MTQLKSWGTVGLVLASLGGLAHAQNCRPPNVVGGYYVDCIYYYVAAILDDNNQLVEASALYNTCPSSEILRQEAA